MSIKNKYPHVEPQVKDAQTIETETKDSNNEFFTLKQQFDKVNNASTEQKKQNETINLIDYVLDTDNPFNNIKTQDIYIKGDLFENNDSI